MKGVTFLETLLYTAILVILVAGLFQISLVIFRVKVQSDAKIEVEQNLRFAMEKISQDIKSATAITGAYPSNTLSLTIEGSNVTYSVSDNILKKTVGTSTFDITTDKVIVSAGNGNIFTEIDQPAPAKSAVQIKLRVKYNSQSPYLKDIESLGQTTISLRQ